MTLGWAESQGYDAARAPPCRATGDDDDWLALTDDELPVGRGVRLGRAPDCGAVVLFSGTVRDHAEGREGVEHLTYEAYDDAVVPRMAAIAAEARQRWPMIGRLAILHRTGRLELGESSVLVVVSTPHRAEAFEAGRYAIDALKASVPIWKHETWRDGQRVGHGSHADRRGRDRRVIELLIIVALVAAVAIVIAVIVSALRRSRSPDGVATFRRQIDALSPGGPAPGRRPGAAARGGRSRHRPTRTSADTMARDLAIDLGTANTLVYMKGRGIVLNEPSVIALNRQTGEVLATGREAWQMIGRTPGYIVAVRPLRGGAITDFEITERMIRLLLQRVGVSRFTRPKVVICVPSAITEVERRAVTDAARRAGAADANLIEQPMAAAIGADLPIDEPVGNMVIDIGGGTSETAVISLGGIVALEAVRVGSFDIDASIQNYVRREHGIAIGERTAEEIKVAIGSADPTEDENQAEVRGRDLMTGLPKTVLLTPEEIRFAIEDVVSSIIASVIRCLAKAPPELSQDFLVRGMYLVGGGGLLRGLAQRIERETKVPVKLSNVPLEAVVLGAGHVIEHYEALKGMFMGARR